MANFQPPLKSLLCILAQLKWWYYGGDFFLTISSHTQGQWYIWKHCTALNNAGTRLPSFLTQPHCVALQQENKKEQPCSEILFPKLHWMDQVEESRKVIEELRHWFCCCSAITRSQEVLTQVRFIHWWKYLWSTLHNVNLSKTSAAGGAL